MIPPHTNRYPKPPSGAATGWGRFFCVSDQWERAAKQARGAKDTWAVMARLRAGHARPRQGSDVKRRSSRKQQSFTPAGVRGRLAAHNERRPFAAQSRSCGCLPRRGKHCSLPSFAALNCGPTRTTPHRVETAAVFFAKLSFAAKRKRPSGRLPSPVQPLRPTPYCGASGSTNSVVKLAVRSLMFIRTLQKTSP